MRMRVILNVLAVYLHAAKATLVGPQLVDGSETDATLPQAPYSHTGHRH